jgi:hypothetical protein
VTSKGGGDTVVGFSKNIKKILSDLFVSEEGKVNEKLDTVKHFFK